MAHLSQALPGLGTDRRELASATLTLLTLRVGGLIAGLGANVFLARLLGVDDYGNWAVIMAIVALLAIPATFGLPNLLVREVSKARSHEDWSALRGIYQWAVRVVSAASLFMGLVGGGLVLLFPVQGVLSPAILAVVIVMIPLSAVTAVMTGFLRGLRHVVLSALPEFFSNRLVFLSILAAFFFLLPSRFSLSTAILIQAATALLTVILLIIVRRRLMSGIPPAPPNLSLRRTWRSAALAMAATQALFELQAQIDKLMIGAFSTTDQVGLYSGGQRWASLLGFLIVTVNLVIGPVLAEFLTKEDRRGAEQLARRAALIVSAVGFPVALTFWLWGKRLLGLFGEEFLAGESALRILTVGQVVNLTAGSVGIMLVMANRERFVTAAVAASTVLNVILNIVLVQRFGASGAAVATSVSMAFWNLVLLWAVRRFVGINPSIVGGALCRA